MQGSSPEEYLYNDIRILRAENGPCPVCGHPTGDCTGDMPPPQKIFGVGIFQSIPHEEVFIVEEDVYEERPITPFSKGRFKIAKKGDAIPMSKARELGLC